MLECIHQFNENLPIEEALMPPSAWYTNREFLDLEKKNIFTKNWQPVARLTQLTESETYISGVTAGIPWVITKDSNDHLRAFWNICSHKGREVVKGCGKANNCELTCGYHAWKFHLNGNLKSAPQMGGIKNFHKEEMGLIPMQVACWGKWIFINADLNAKAITEQLGELTTMLSERNCSSLKFHSTKEWIINCNWKVYIDNYLDGGYHIPFMHPSLDNQLDMSSYKTVLFDKFNIQTSAATKTSDTQLDYDPQIRIGDGSIYAWVYPNFMINIYGNIMDTNFVTPVDENTCKVTYEFYFLDQNEDFIQTSIKQSDVTQIEDIEICESVQLGLKSGMYRRGRYAPSLEIGEYHFHRLLKQDYLH